MSSRAIKVSENTYNHLKRMSEEESVSMKEIVDRMAESEKSIKEYKGSWNLSDKELEEIKEEREEIWENWKV